MTTDPNIPTDTLQLVLQEFGLPADSHVEQLGTGLINTTWKVHAAAGAYILQRMNVQVFRQPELIHENLRMIRDYLADRAPEYRFVAPLAASNGTDLLQMPGQQYYRLFPFVEGSHTIDVVATPEQAYEAAFQFGQFTALLADFDARRLHVTLPDFHNLPLRYEQFLRAIQTGNPQRVQEAKELIEGLKTRAQLVAQYRSLISDPAVPLRVMHHDTKISNVLFDASERGLAVIDLDTVMPGYFFSDAGDMMRTYLCPVSEEEKDFSKIEVRDAFYKAILNGYSAAMKQVLTETEKKSFFFSGQCLIYMQALRFLTDHLNNDSYYGAAYEGHNFVRAGNQFTLLRRYSEREEQFGNR